MTGTPMGDGVPVEYVMTQFQDSVDEWGLECFGEEILYNKEIRGHRFLEEALELVQAIGMTKESAAKVLDYVYGREKGEISQEIAGTFVTLNTLATAFDVDVAEASLAELDRIRQPEIIEKIRKKSAAKPSF